MAADSSWSTDALQTHLQAQIDALTHRVDERIAFVQLAMQSGAGAMGTKITDLERFLNERHQAQIAAVTAAFVAAEKSVVKAEIATDKRFDSVNEFRTQLSDQAATFISRVEAEAELRQIAQRTDELLELARTLIPRLEYQAAHDRLIEQVRDLATRITALEGRGAGFSAAWVYAIGLISLIGTAFSVYRAVTGK